MLPIKSAFKYKLFVFNKPLFIRSVLESRQTAPDHSQTCDMGAKRFIRFDNLSKLQARAQRCVRTALFSACNAPFTAIVNRRYARHRIEQGIGVIKMGTVAQHGCKTVDIVVIDKIIKTQIFIDAAVSKLPVQGISDFKIVFVIVRGIKALLTLIVGDGIKHIGIGPSIVVAMDDLAHQPEIRAFLTAVAAQPSEKGRIHTVSRIKPQAVDSKFVHPHADRAKQMINDLWILQIQLNKIKVPLPALIPEGVAHRATAAEVEIMKPSAISGCLAVFTHIFKCPEGASDMVKDAVKYNADTMRMERFTNFFEICVGSKPPVKRIIIGRIVSMLARLKDRAEVDGIDMQL